MHLNDEQLAIRESVGELARKVIAPRASAIDETEEYPWDIVELFRKQDVYSLPFPPQYGGLSGSALTLLQAVRSAL